MPSVRSDVVVNTGPVLALSAAGYLHVLRDLFTRVTIPYEVVREIEAGGQTQFARDEFRAASWMDKRSVSVSVSPLLQSTLDPGEAAVVALATAEQIATVAIDETVGRRIARLHVLTVTGSLGVLIRAKQQGAQIRLRTAIERMRQQGIWLSDALEKECLRLAGE
jgi:predicted nucleic acid-binding protein